MSIQWFPGHMAKATRQMEEQLKMVDIIIELRDARIPEASGNPLLKKLSVNKPVLIILNKADLADEQKSKQWQKTFDNCLILNSKADKIDQIVVNEIKRILKDKIEKAKKRGIAKKTLRAMVVGIPNVGKSTFINSIVKRKIAKVENRPGVTKSLQWIRINDDVELLDTPGVLWPKFDNQDDAKLLALLGSINDDVLDKEEIVNFALNYIKNKYPDLLEQRYGSLDDSNNLVEKIALNKSWLISAGQANTAKCVDSLLKDIRSNKLGRITWQDVRE